MKMNINVQNVAAAAALVAGTMSFGAGAQDALRVSDDGSIGIGISSPTSSLHVFRNDGSAEIKVEEEGSNGKLSRMFSLVNNGDPSFVLRDKSSENAAEFRLFGEKDDFVISHIANGRTDFRLSRAGRLVLGAVQGVPKAQLISFEDGDLEIGGTLSQNSDVHSKQAITAVNGQEILGKLMKLDISSWQYKADTESATHIGPMAQDFHSVFDVGDEPTKLAPGDMAGVALAAIQEQQRLMDKLRAENTELRRAVVKLEGITAAVRAELKLYVQAQSEKAISSR